MGSAYLQYVAFIQLSQLEKDVLTSLADSASPLRRNPRSISRGTLRAMATSIVGILATRSSADALLFAFVLFCFWFIFYVSLFGFG